MNVFTGIIIVIIGLGCLIFIIKDELDDLTETVIDSKILEKN